MKKFTLAFFVFMAIFVNVFAGEKVVFVDTQKVFTQSKAGVDIKNMLEKKAEEAKNYIQTKASLVNQNDPKAMQELQQEAMKKQQELQQLQQRVVSKFAEFIKSSLNEFAKQKGYQIVVDKQAVLYGKEKYDITDEFLQYINKKYETQKPKFE